MTTDPCFLGIHELHDRLRRREVSAVELAGALFDRIEATDGTLGAYLAVCRDQGMEDARQADARLAAGEVSSKLLGNPGGAQGRVPDGGRAHHLRVEDPARVHAALMTAPRCAASRTRGAVVLGKTNHGRVRHGLLHRELRLFHHPQPLESRPRTRRLLGRLRRRGVGRPVHRRAGHRHRRVDPPAGVLLRRGWGSSPPTDG